MYLTNRNVPRQSRLLHVAQVALMVIVLTGLVLFGTGCSGSGANSESGEGSESGPGDETSEENKGPVTAMIDSGGNSSSSTRASGTLTATFYYNKSDGSTCTGQRTVSVSSTPAEEDLDPSGIDCDSPTSFDGVRVIFSPASGSLSSELTLTVTGSNGDEIASDTNPSDGLEISWGSAPSIDGSDTIAPVAPSNLTGASGEGEISLNWDAVGARDLQKYNVYRSTSSSVEVSQSPVVTTSAPSTSVTDGGATNGTTYYYVVTAVDGSGNESPPSGAVQRTPFARPPERP
jgi:hypothetical protein